MERSQHIADRTVEYSLAIIKLYRQLQPDDVGRILGKQLLRSGTSIGANVQEAQAAQSKADFIAKISIAHKEARETGYWLRLLREATLVPTQTLDPLADEAGQISRILAASLITAKKNCKARPSDRPTGPSNSSL